MTEISRVALFGKLNSVTYKSIDSATVFCKLRSNPYVELAHWLHALLQSSGSDWSYIIRYFGLEPLKLATDLVASLDALPTGATSIADFSPEVEDAVHSSWVYATLMFASPAIRSGYFLVGLLKTKRLHAALQRISAEFSKISVETLTANFDEIVEGSIEEGTGPQDGTQLVAPSPNRDIFICYRHSDSRHITGRIFDRLEREFGADRVFKDVNSIPVGVVDFAVEIRAQIATAKIMLVVIGETWTSDADKSGRPRILDAEDFVHVELKYGLDRQIAVVPLLCDEVPMPTEEQLPPALKPFVRVQGMRMRADPDFNNDMEKLIAACRSLSTSVPTPK